MNVLGVYGGIGSMLIGAQQAGCNIVGNIEPRDFEDGSTFTKNFDAPFFNDFKMLDSDDFCGSIDIVVGHPSCGSYSAINWRREKVKRAEIENFVFSVKRIRPKFFVMDNLPKMFLDYSSGFWLKNLSDEYDITPVWVNNRYYGNAQVRKRVYLIGSKREYSFVPIAGESRHVLNRTKDVIGHLVFPNGKIQNHNDVDHDSIWSAMTNVRGPGLKSTYREMYDIVVDYPSGKSFKYYKANGELGVRIGLTKVHWDKHCSTLSSTARQIHPIRCTPLTIKEQLLLMGYPNNFKIYGTPVDDLGRWKTRGLEYHKVNKGVCVQSITYFMDQIVRFIRSEGKDIIDPEQGLESDSNQDVNRFKFQWCSSEQTRKDRRKCFMCHMNKVCRIGRSFI